MTAHRNKEIGGYDYRGYYFYKPEGSQYWNICNVDEKGIDFCFPICSCVSFKECKVTIDEIVE